MLHIEGSTHQRPTRSKSLISVLLPIGIVITVAFTLVAVTVVGYSWYMAHKEGEGRACRYDTSKGNNTQKELDCYNI